MWGNKKPFANYFHSLQTALYWLPSSPRNPNFYYEIILGLTNAKSKNRWIIFN